MINSLKYTAEKFAKNETVYLLNEFEEIAMKLVPSKNDYKCICKFEGVSEYEILKTTNLAMETKMGGLIITKKQYDEY